MARKGQSDEREKKEEKEEEEEEGGTSIFHATFFDCSHRVERGLLNRLLRVFVGPVDIIIERESGAAVMKLDEISRIGGRGRPGSL